MSKSLHIYDGLNWIRQALESNSYTLRQLFYQLSYSQDKNIIVWEGKGGNNLRRKFYPEYKRNRVRPAEDIFKTIDLFRQLVSHAPVYQIAMDGYEGDDVVAGLANYFSDVIKVYIHSTDKDFRQLVPKGITVDSNVVKDVDDRYIRLYKTLVGDPSDNIKGLSGFGEVAFKRLDCKYVLPFFERGDFAGFLPEAAFMEQKHFLKLQQDVHKIATYWKITGFFPLSLEEMVPHLKLGVSNIPEAERLMKHYIIN